MSPALSGDLSLDRPHSPTADLRLAIIGLGKIGAVHLRNLQQIAQAELAAIHELQPGHISDLPENVRIYSDWMEVFRDPEIDAVIITLPHALHADCAHLALAHGKHVFLEKPLATTLADARSLVESARRAERTLMVNMTHRFYPPVREARRLVREGLLGDIISVRDHYMEVIDRSDFPAWFFDPAMAGGGVTMTDSIHLVDRISWILNEPLTLKGRTSRRIDPHSLVEDSSELLCESASGISAVIGSFFTFDSEKTWDDNLTIFGTKGTLVVHAWSHVEWTPHGQITHFIQGYDPALPLTERAAVGHRAALEEFLAAIREDRSPEADSATVLNTQEVVQDFYDAF